MSDQPQSLTIRTGIRLLVNDDPDRVIAFDPDDVQFAERFYDLYRVMFGDVKRYEARAAELDAVTETDENGWPVNAGERLVFQRELCQDMHAQIDALFGEGTARAAFGDSLSVDSIMQFFEGVMPFIQSARAERVAKYAKPAAQGKGRKVMK